jgi:hypothetical protein
MRQEVDRHGTTQQSDPFESSQKKEKKIIGFWFFGFGGPCCLPFDGRLAGCLYLVLWGLWGLLSALLVLGP